MQWLMDGEMSPLSEYKEGLLVRNSTKTRDRQLFIQYYKEKTGITEVDMKDVAAFALKNGWSAPKPIDPVDRLAQQFTQAAREETKHDKKTGQPYRVNHAVPVKHGGTQLHLWIDIDEAPRKLIHKSLMMRREQMVGDGLQLTLDADHWNGIHPDEEPMDIPLDFTDDVLWRKNAIAEEKKAI
jgi:hypothetical protein